MFRPLRVSHLLEFILCATLAVLPTFAQSTHSKDKTNKTFFEQFFAAYFYKLAQSDNMPAFAHMVDATANKEANDKWAAENAQQVTALSDWLQKTERGF